MLDTAVDSSHLHLAQQVLRAAERAGCGLGAAAERCRNRISDGWLGVLANGSQFGSPIVSGNRTKTWGSLTNSLRSPEQTTIGLFWTANPGAAFNSMLTDLVSRQSLSTLDSARLFAMVFAGYGDAFIGCMNAKYLFNFWRPVTAIQEGGGNAQRDESRRRLLPYLNPVVNSGRGFIQ
jgi:hypothetical protein